LFSADLLRLNHLPMVTNLSAQYSVLCDWITEIRDQAIQQDSLRFRHNLERIGEVAAYEISKRLACTEREVITPLGTAAGKTLSMQPVLATILRAGIPMLTGLSRIFDQAGQAFVGAYRKHRSDGSFDISLDYVSCPPLGGRVLILADPMLATGASLVKALHELHQQGTPTEIHVVAAIAATPGIHTVETAFPNASLWVGDVDPVLNDRGYIIPGLGDAGDLAYGPKTSG
jgi:uracil phosphoribosyltransferase